MEQNVMEQIGKRVGYEARKRMQSPGNFISPGPPGGQGISQLLFAASCARGRTTPCFPGQISAAVGAWRGLHQRAASCQCHDDRQR